MAIPTTASPRAIPYPMVGLTWDDVSNVNGIVDTLKQVGKPPSSRVVFDYSEPPSYYLGPLQKMHPYSYTMGELLDSSDMGKVTVQSYAARAQKYFDALKSVVDIWEIGNEINGDWLGRSAMAKAEAAHDVIKAGGGVTALTLFYTGEAGQSNCFDGTNMSMSQWVHRNFQLGVDVSHRDPDVEKMRQTLDYALVSWYPTQCTDVRNPDWESVFKTLAGQFPNAKVGFGEVGTPRPKAGSTVETNLIKTFYGMTPAMQKVIPRYIGGVFWWYAYEEMIPPSKTSLFNTMNSTIAVY